MTDTSSALTHPPPFFKYPVLTLKTEQNLFQMIKKRTHITKAIIINLIQDDNPHGLDEEQLFKKLNVFLKNTKFTRHLTVEKLFLSNPHSIEKFLTSLRRFNNLRKLRFRCQNNSLDDRIADYKTLKPFERFKRLETVFLNIFFDPLRQSLYKQFGGLVQVLRTKCLLIKEPLVMATDRHLKKFYKRGRRASGPLHKIFLNNVIPFGVPFKESVPYQFTKEANNLRVICLNFVGMSLSNKCFENLVEVIGGMGHLTSFNLDLSFNNISDLAPLDQLTRVSLTRLYLNLSYCPLNKGSYQKLAGFIASNCQLKMIELTLNSVNITRNQVLQLSNMIVLLNELTDLSISLAETQSIDIRTLWRFFAQLLLSQKLMKLNLNLTQALCGDTSMAVHTTPMKSLCLKSLELNLNENKIKAGEIIQTLNFLKYCPSLESLKLSIDNSKFQGFMGESTWEWLTLLGKLRTLDLSVINTEIPENCFNGLLRIVSRRNIPHLKIDLSDSLYSRSLAKYISEAECWFQNLRTMKLDSRKLEKLLPPKIEDMLLGSFLEYEII